MAPIAAGSPFRPRSRSRGPTTRSPSPPPLAPKSYIDLNSSTRSSEHITGSKVSTRAYLCDVVVEGPENNETRALLSQLGQPVERPTALPRPPQPQASTNLGRSPSDPEDVAGSSASKQEEMEKRQRALLEEFVRTERSYVSRIKALKTVRVLGWGFATDSAGICGSPSTLRKVS